MTPPIIDTTVQLRLLGGFETLLLLAVIQLDGQAYGVTVREELKTQAGKDVAVGAIYTGQLYRARRSTSDGRPWVLSAP